MQEVCCGDALPGAGSVPWGRQCCVGGRRRRVCFDAEWFSRVLFKMGVGAGKEHLVHSMRT